jgi:kynurenine formamidase
MPRWPGDPPTEFSAAATLGNEGYFLRRFSLGEHSGTHLNAPAAFHEGGVGVDAFPPESLVAPAAVLDVRALVAADPDFVLGVTDILAWEARHGRLASGTLVLLCAGWSERWSEPSAFRNADATGRLRFPAFSPEAARFLLEERAAGGLGTDTPGLDPAWDETFAVNRLVLEKPRLALECLARLDEMPPLGAVVVVGCLRLQGGSGSPASVLALLP